VGRRGDYLYKRKGSPYWWLKFQYPPRLAELVGKKVHRESTGETDYTKARLKVAQKVYDYLHDRDLLSAEHDKRYRGSMELVPEFKPGEKMYLSDGSVVEADDEGNAVFRFPDGKIKIRPNPKVERFNLILNPAEQRERQEALEAVRKAQPDKPVEVEEDQLLIEAYLSRKALPDRTVKEVRDTLARFKTLVNGKRFADCDRADGEKLYHWYRENGDSKRGKEGNNLQTCQKKVGWLRAAVNIAIKDGRLKFNPFSGVVPTTVIGEDGRKTTEEQKRRPFDEEEIALIYQHLYKLRPDDQMMFRWAEMTGMRLSEVCEIDEEFTERVKGRGPIRYVIIGRKTAESERRVPIPTALIPFLPEKITSPLIPNREEADRREISKRLNRFFRRIGIMDRRKVFHSTRHRAQDRLRAMGCPEDQRWAIGGHEEKTVAAGYGAGFPLWQLLPWVDQIGWHPEH
jgi:integrase